MTPANCGFVCDIKMYRKSQISLLGVMAKKPRLSSFRCVDSKPSGVQNFRWLRDLTSQSETGFAKFQARSSLGEWVVLAERISRKGVVLYIPLHGFKKRLASYEWKVCREYLRFVNHFIEEYIRRYALLEADTSAPKLPLFLSSKQHKHIQPTPFLHSLLVEFLKHAGKHQRRTDQSLDLFIIFSQIWTPASTPVSSLIRSAAVSSLCSWRRSDEGKINSDSLL